MALPIVTSYNFEQTVEELKNRIDTTKLYIYSVISSRDVEGNPGPKKRLYIAIDPDVNISEYTLQFARFCQIKDNFKTTVYDEETGTYKIKRHKSKHFGWHQVWAIPQNLKQPLFNKLILKSEPYDEYNGKILYEVTWEGYDCLYDFLIENQNTGYIAYKTKIVLNPAYSSEAAEEAYENGEDYDVPTQVKSSKRYEITYLDMICSSKCGIALVKNGKIVSNYAKFKGIRNEHKTSTEGLLNEGYTHDEIFQIYANYFEFPDGTSIWNIKQTIETKMHSNEQVKQKIFSLTR